MRSNGSSKFITVSRLGNDPARNSYRILVPFNGRLYTSPTGQAHGRHNLSESPTVLECSDLDTGEWHPVSVRGFGDSTNTTVFEMVAFNGFLYAATLNPSQGFQIWKTKPGGRFYRWTKVITEGAYRGILNEAVLSMCVFNNALYVGTGIQNGGYDRTYKIGPAAAELIRIHPDDSWDLIVGEPRLTPEGYKFPLSGSGPGFGDLFNAYIWRMAVHNGWLYAGTYNWSIWLRYISIDTWPIWMRKLLNEFGIKNVVANHAGFDLWRSCDGITWVPVTRTGFNNSYNYGARTMVSTPFGLFIATANPFAPEVAVEDPPGWTYEPNQKGGLEVWLGGAPEQTDGWDGMRRSPRDPRVGSRAASAPRGSKQALSTISNINERYDERMFDELADEYFGYSDFHNFGYWTYGTRTQRAACENLMEKLLSFIPRKNGRILDVGCGRGASTKYLLNYYEPSKVTGINISSKQLQWCRTVSPDCTFLLMDATQLDFPDESFDNIICVESAFHFNKREDFLHEASRVLKPGGRLVLSDVLFKSKEIQGLSPYMTATNYVKNLKDYESLYRKAEFEDIKIINATNECLGQFEKHYRQFLRDKFLAAQVDRQTLRKKELSLFISGLTVSHYLFVSARKPR
jgi:ubiquinone/menaquinone biosynthesis C-methylase UbiE